MIVDRLLQEKVGFGKAQYLPLIFLSLVDLNDGAQLILSSFLTPIVQHLWDLNQSQIQTLTSIFYIATFLGSITSGRLSDQFGRRPLIICGSVLQIIVSSTFFWVDNYSSMLLARGAYGFSYGFTIAITTSIFAEISPPKYRGKGILFLNFCVSLGKLYGLLLAYIFLDTFTSGNWKAMMICSCIPNLFVLFGSLTVIKQSPRFLIGANRLEESYQTLENMIQINNPGSSTRVEDDQKLQIKQYYENTFEGKQRAQFSTLFNQYYIRTTICLSVAWFCINMIYFGQLVVLPFIFGRQNKSFTSYTLTVLGQIPSFLISVFLVDRNNFGRKNSLKYFFCGSACMHFLFMFDPIVLFSSICRLFMKMCFQMLYPCTTQSYGTLNRTLGFGFNSAIGRLGATFMPFIILPLLDVSIPMISGVFCAFSFIGAFGSWMLPYETMGRALDYKSQSSDSDEPNNLKGELMNENR